MSRVSFFQRFSQPENHATNNTMLLLRYFFERAPSKVQAVLSSIFSADLMVGFDFNLQDKGKNSVPDAVISQQPISIFIEAKRSGELDSGQIERHIETILAKNLPYRPYLLGLTRFPLPKDALTNFVEMADRAGITFATTTFSDLASDLSDQCKEFEVELQAVLSDFLEYLSDSSLLDERGQMAIFPCRTSLSENERFRLYYEPPTRSLKRTPFIGIYSNKVVRLIGKVGAIIVYDPTLSDPIVAVEFGTPTPDHLDRINLAINASTYYPEMRRERHRHYLMDDVSETNVRKSSSGGIMGFRYLDLAAVSKDKFDRRRNYSAQELADTLMGGEFE